MSTWSIVIIVIYTDEDLLLGEFIHRVYRELWDMKGPCRDIRQKQIEIKSESNNQQDQIRFWSVAGGQNQEEPQTQRQQMFHNVKVRHTESDEN